jgi:hypothetical protein
MSTRQNDITFYAAGGFQHGNMTNATNVIGE